MKRYFVKPGSKFKLRKFKPSDTGDFHDNGRGMKKAEEQTQKILSRLNDLQELLYADASRSLLIILQGMDTSGKDGTIEHVMSVVNPQGCRVKSFKTPSQEEVSHDFLWRIHQEVPPKGFIGIFNRSHYEDVIVPRVHGQISEKTVEKRFRQIIDFEHLLVQNGTAIRKFFLHISKDEQRRRLQARVDNPKKHWKFNITDLRERKYWDRYQDAFQDMIGKTSTKQAPWIIVPADHKWYRNLVVGEVVVKTFKEMDLSYPPGPSGIDFRNLKIR